MIKVDCPECTTKQSLTVAFGDPYHDFGDGGDEDDFRVELVRQDCKCDLEDDERAGEMVTQWDRECYPYQIEGEWHESLYKYKTSEVDRLG